MKKYMLIVLDGDEQEHALFFDNYKQAQNARYGVEVGQGLYAELYVRDHIDGPHSPMAYRIV